MDIDDINPEGLLYDDKDVAPILEKFRKEKVDGLFVPHCNFGTEYVVARLARELGCRCCCEAPGTSGRTRTACACGTASAACSPRARCCGGSRCPLPT